MSLPAYNFKQQPLTAIQFPDNSPDKLSLEHLQELEHTAQNNTQHALQLPVFMAQLWKERKSFLNKQKGAYKRWSEKEEKHLTNKQDKTKLLPNYMSEPAYNF